MHVKLFILPKYVLSELLFSVNRASNIYTDIYMIYPYDIGTFLLFLVAHRKERYTNV